MATASRTNRGLKFYRFTVRQFAKMVDDGYFANGPRVELLGGRIVQSMTKNEPHCFAVGELSECLRRIIPPGWSVREEKPVVLDDYWRPEPDLAVARGQNQNYKLRFPQAEELGLIIEVADTSYVKDSELMKRRYALAGIATYWIVNIRQRRIEVFTNPADQENPAAYRTVAEYQVGQDVPVILVGVEVGRIPVASILP